MIKFAYIAFFLCCFNVSGQIDTVQNISEVYVSTLELILIEKTHNLILERDDIIELQPTDIGDLLRKVPGANLRSYGGLGGLKTVSMRSLGANHSSIVVDGVPLNNSQTGQVNLGQLMVDNVEKLTSSVGLNSNMLLPVSAQISGSNFVIQTMENSFARDTLTIRANLGGGSFGQMRGYAGVKYNPNKYFVSVFGSAQKAQGNYKYSVANGLEQINGIRRNNKYQDYNFGISTGVKFKKGQWRFGYRHKTIEQELPGSVIFYNETADELLETSSDRLFTDFKFRIKKLYTHSFLNAAIDHQRYFDPTYLNAAGEIDNQFNNRNVNGGISFIYYRDKWNLFGGIEETVSNLEVNDLSFAEPTRFHSFGMIGGRLNHALVTISAQLSGQYLFEENNNGNVPRTISRLNPFLSIKSREWGQRSQLELWYRNSFRVPTFNELYYNNIGNINLLPEDAHQLNAGFLWTPSFRKFKLDWKSNIFFNQVKNKIVAVPTKNLFIWSMQNIGKTNTFGAEIQFEAKFEVNEIWKFVLNTNYTYQKTIDITDPDSPTYLHQVAYIPEHTANADVTFQYHQTGIRISNYFVSHRYVLNENIESNEIAGFFLTDLSVFHTFNLGTNQNLKLIGNIKNIFNSSYAYIRSYVMPGVNYSISLSYAFN